MVLKEFEPHIENWILVPSSGGRFEITVNGDLVYSKAQTGRHPEADEIRQALKNKLG